MNEKQLEAIKSLDNTLVIAGAGSGKTYTIINKVKNIIENKEYKEEEILLISFTNESVNDLKRKINYNIDTLTFHKLGLNILKKYNYTMCSENTLEYIINEYLESYVKNNKQSKKRYKRILKEIENNELKKLFKTFINIYKSNYSNIDHLYNLWNNNHFITKEYLRMLLEIYAIYNNELESNNYLDFNDILIKSTKLIKENKIKLKYKYIIIDEFQDTSKIRLDLILSILELNNGKLFAVGDDYQSIYKFSGCNLKLFTNLKDYIPNLNIIKLDYNYRNPKEIIQVANKFIMKNKTQIKKNTITQKNINKPIKIYYYVDKQKDINKLTKIISSNYIILGRNNNDIKKFNINPDKFLTIHKSKGLEEENIILVNIENNITSLPSKIKNHKILEKIIEPEEYPYAEERRLFYVALTRTKNNIYIYANKNSKSIFLKELIREYKEYIEIIK